MRLLAVSTSGSVSLSDALGWFIAGSVCVAATTALWALVVSFELLARPRYPTTTQRPELRAEPPAVVSWLVCRFDPHPNAVAATFVDLVARKVLAIQHVGGTGGIPEYRVLDPQPAALTAYEKRVFDHVRGIAGTGTVPLTALNFANWSELRTWHKAFAREVRADARRLGLSQSRLGGTAAAGMAVGALTPASMVFCAFLSVQWLLGIVAAVGYMYLLWRLARRFLVGDTYTPHGIVATSHWLGVRHYLQESPTFEDLPISAVVLWDRYLAYAAALGCSPKAASAVAFARVGGLTLPEADLEGHVPPRRHRRWVYGYESSNYPPT